MPSDRTTVDVPGVGRHPKLFFPYSCRFTQKNIQKGVMSIMIIYAHANCYMGG